MTTKYREKLTSYSPARLATDEEALGFLRERCGVSDVSTTKDLKEQIEDLGLQQNEIVRSAIDSSRKTVAIYHPTRSFREHYGDIVTRLRDYGVNVVILLGGFLKQHGFDDDPMLFYAGHGIIRYFDFVDLYISVEDLPPATPLHGNKLNLEHSVDLNMVRSGASKGRLVRTAAIFDHYFVPVQPAPLPVPVDLRGRIPEPMFAHLSNEFSLIHGGYVKLDQLTRYYEQHCAPKKTIVYAATMPRASGAPLDRHGHEIFSSILETFPDHELIFRPHPHSIEFEYVQTAIAPFLEHPRFIFDTAGSYLDLFASAGVLISDLSDSATNYALASKRAVVWTSFDGKQVKDLMLQVGLVAEHTPGLLSCIAHLMTNPTDVAGNIEYFLSQRLANLGRAEDCLFDVILSILAGRKGEDWTVFSLGRDDPMRHPESMFFESLRTLIEIDHDLQGAEVILGQGKIMLPESPMFSSLESQIKAALGKR